MGYQKARYEVRRAALSEEFGQKMAAQHFAQSLEKLTDRFGVYKSGPRKGKCRGYYVWLKIIEGGWVHEFGVLHPSKKARALVTNEELIQMNESKDSLNWILQVGEDPEYLAKRIEHYQEIEREAQRRRDSDADHKRQLDGVLNHLLGHPFCGVELEWPVYAGVYSINA